MLIVTHSVGMFLISHGMHSITITLVHSFFAAAQERDRYMELVCCHSGPPHMIDQKDIFSTVLKLFDSQDIMKEYPMRITFKGELAVDTGGVFIEMIYAFWEVVYSRFCDGDALLVPLVHPGSDINVFSQLGKVLSHGYLQCEFLPLRITLHSQHWPLCYWEQCVYPTHSSFVHS